jgi:hypothetical protein
MTIIDELNAQVARKRASDREIARIAGMTVEEYDTDTTARTAASRESEMDKKPNCYECIYRGRIPGSVHSSCQHPKIAECTRDPMLRILAIFASVGRAPAIQ